MMPSAAMSAMNSESSVDSSWSPCPNWKLSMKWKYWPVPRSQKTSGFSSLPDGGAANLPWKPMNTPLFRYGGNDGGAKMIPGGPSVSGPSAPFGSPGAGHGAHGGGRDVTSGC